MDSARPCPSGAPLVVDTILRLRCVQGRLRTRVMLVMTRL